MTTKKCPGTDGFSTEATQLILETNNTANSLEFQGNDTDALPAAPTRPEACPGSRTLNRNETALITAGFDPVKPAKNFLQNKLKLQQEVSSDTGDTKPVSIESLESGGKTAVTRAESLDHSARCSLETATESDETATRFAGISQPNFNAPCEPFDAEDDVSILGSTFATVTSSTEECASARAFADEQAGLITAESGSKRKARGEKLARVVILMQYHRYKNRVIFTQEQFDQGISELESLGLLGRWAAVWHTKDSLYEHVWHEDAGFVIAELRKAPHLHAVVELKKPQRIKRLAKIFGVAPSFIEVAGSELERSGGRGKREMIMQNNVRYLVHRHGSNIRAASQGKPYHYIYPISDLRSNFDVRELIFREIKAPSGSSGKLGKRVQELRQLVMHGELDLEQAAAHDPEAFAQDVVRLRLLEGWAQTHRESGLGELYEKAPVLISGASRTGKDLLAGMIAEELRKLAAEAGQEWRISEPAGKNALEDAANAEVIHHQDARFHWVPSYDESLRYLDPFRAPKVAARYANKAALAPRAILLTTSCGAEELAMTMKARKSSEALVAQWAAEEEAALNRGATRSRGTDLDQVHHFTANLDEFLFRFRFIVDLRRIGSWKEKDLSAIKANLIARVWRYVPADREHPERRTVDQRGAGGNSMNHASVGYMTTLGEREEVALLYGGEQIARWLALRIVQDCSYDLREALAEKLPVWLEESRTAEVSPDDFELMQADRIAALPWASEPSFYAASLWPGHGFVDCLGRAAYWHYLDHHLAGLRSPDPSAIFELVGSSAGHEVLCSVCDGVTRAVDGNYFMELRRTLERYGFTFDKAA